MSHILVAMRHTWIARSFAALFAVWFAVSLAEPAALHACAMHGGGAVAGHRHAPATHTGASHTGASHMGASHMGASHMAATHDGGAPDSHDAAKHCTCLGACTASSGSAIVPSADAGFDDIGAIGVASGPPAFRARVVTAPPFFLPFANGPPAPLVLA